MIQLTIILLHINSGKSTNLVDFLEKLFYNNYEVKKMTLATCIISGAITLILIIISILTIILDKQLTTADKLAKIKSILPDIILKVENVFGSGNGDLKKEYALVETQKQCIAQKLKLTPKLIEELSQDIERILKTPQKKPQ